MSVMPSIRIQSVLDSLRSAGGAMGSMLRRKKGSISPGSFISSIIYTLKSTQRR